MFSGVGGFGAFCGGVAWGDSVVLVGEVGAVVGVFVAARGALVGEVFGDLRLFREEVVGDAFGGDVRVDALRTAFLAFENPAALAHEATVRARVISRNTECS